MMSTVPPEYCDPEVRMLRPNRSYPEDLTAASFPQLRDLHINCKLCSVARIVPVHFIEKRKHPEIAAAAGITPLHPNIRLKAEALDIAHPTAHAVQGSGFRVRLSWQSSCQLCPC
jgi:hypothetical protein